jgi:hypothetical protein
MGTATHDEELDFLQPIAESLQRQFGRQVRFDVVGVASRGQLARCFHRVMPEEGPASQTYPGFVEWFCRQHWDIAVSPLIDSPFNRCKSAIKLFDYAALALPVRGHIRDWRSRIRRAARRSPRGRRDRRRLQACRSAGRVRRRHAVAAARRDELHHA